MSFDWSPARPLGKTTTIAALFAPANCAGKCGLTMTVQIIDVTTWKNVLTIGYETTHNERNIDGASRGGATIFGELGRGLFGELGRGQRGRSFVRLVYTRALASRA